MDLMKLFQDEALVEILGFATICWTHEDDRTTIWVKPFNEIEITKTQMEVIIDFFVDYQVYLNLISDPIFVVEDYKKLDTLESNLM